MSTDPNPADGAPTDEPHQGEPAEPSSTPSASQRNERASPPGAVGPGGRAWAIVLIVLGIVMVLLALGMQLPGPAYVGVVPLLYGLGSLAAARIADRARAQHRIALFSGIAAGILVFAIGAHLALAEDDLELDLGFGVLATVLAAALTGIHLASGRGGSADDTPADDSA